MGDFLEDEKADRSAPEVVLGPPCSTAVQRTTWHLSYRLLPKGIAPHPTALEVPGWGGEKVRARDGAAPQPWHCQPFLEGSLYGLELIYPYDTECEVAGLGTGVEFVADFTKEIVPGVVWPPFRVANPGHYSLGTLIDLKVPKHHALRIEPHPRFFNDASGSVPVPVIGNLQTHWWPMFFFVTFKAPAQGQSHIFRRGEPYAQVIVVPTLVDYHLTRMSPQENSERHQQAQSLMRNRGQIASRSWTSADGLPFDDLYKQMNRRHAPED